MEIIKQAGFQCNCSTFQWPILVTNARPIIKEWLLAQIQPQIDQAIDGYIDQYMTGSLGNLIYTSDTSPDCDPTPNIEIDWVSFREFLQRTFGEVNHD